MKFVNIKNYCTFRHVSRSNAISSYVAIDVNCHRLRWDDKTYLWDRSYMRWMLQSSTYIRWIYSGFLLNSWELMRRTSCSEIRNAAPFLISFPTPEVCWNLIFSEAPSSNENNVPIQFIHPTIHLSARLLNCYPFITNRCIRCSTEASKQGKHCLLRPMSPMVLKENIVIVS